MSSKRGPRPAGPPDQIAQIDCRGRTVAEVVGPIIPWCRQARSHGGAPVIALHNLELLQDSVSSLLKSLDRLAVDYGMRVTLSDRSGLTRAFLKVAAEAARTPLPGHGRVFRSGLKLRG